MKHLGFLFFFVFCIHTISFAQNFDSRVLHKINGIQNKFIHQTSNFLSNTTPYLSVGVPAAIGLYSLFSKNEQLFMDAVYIGSSLGEALVLTYGLKYAIHRERPFNKYDDIVKRDDVGSYSFPSGHTSSAFSVATSLSIRYQKWYVIAPAMVWATGVGFARMYEGVHYPSDVLCGAVLGAGTAWLNYKLNQWIMRGYKGKIFRH